MDPEKLKKMQSAVRTGGRGTARRKKAVHKGGQIDEKRLQDIHKKSSAALVAGANEVKIYIGQIILHIVNATAMAVNCPQPIADKQGGQAPARRTCAQASTLHCYRKT